MSASHVTVVQVYLVRAVDAASSPCVLCLFLVGVLVACALCHARRPAPVQVVEARPVAVHSDEGGKCAV